ncbi:MAG: radical SAM protein [Candidatus Accumulibacter sp.]|nr:radical SAM protein [Accumulibacter sp.]
MLKVTDHSRDSAGLTYVYPVVSRRAGGVSVGINLNVNNACNWACVYCQVPDLTRGGPPPIDLDRLEAELRGFLHAATHGDFLERNAPPEARRLMDVAFSGNGEPTSAAEFDATVERVERVLRDFGLLDSLKLRLITNGSLLHRPEVQRGIARIGAIDGEIWLKVDRATEEAIARVNGIRLAPEKIEAALLRCADLAPTWVQTCYFAIDGQESSEAEQAAYLALIGAVRQKIKGVHLYGLARPSLQPDAQRLSNVAPENFRRFAERIAALDVEVVANP